MYRAQFMPWLCCFTFSLTHLHQHQHQHPYRIVTVAFAVPQHCPYQMLHATNSSRRISKCMQIFKERDKESRTEKERKRERRGVKMLRPKMFIFITFLHGFVNQDRKFSNHNVMFQIRFAKLHMLIFQLQIKSLTFCFV